MDSRSHPLFKPFRLAGRVSAVERTRSATEREGGGTFTEVGTEAPASKRYVYNPERTVAKVPPKASFEQYRDALRELHASDPERFRKGERYVGTYRDDTGTVHFDPSVASNDLNEARRTATKANQHSIWDRKEGKEIVVCKGECKHMGETA